jgi:hypothetical protein
MEKPLKQLIFCIAMLCSVNPHVFQNITPVQSLLFSRINIFLNMTTVESGIRYALAISILQLIFVFCLMTCSLPTTILPVMFFFSLTLAHFVE